MGDAGSRASYSAAHFQLGRLVHLGYFSLADMFDTDLLLDRLGFIDHNPPLSYNIRCGPLANETLKGKSSNAGGLTSISKRLSEETLKDCRAFHGLIAIDDLGHLGGRKWGPARSSPCQAWRTPH